MNALAVTRARGIADRLPTAHRSAPSLIASLIARIARWARVAHERRRLLELDDRLLVDMGLTREAASREAGRPFWDADGRTGR